MLRVLNLVENQCVFVRHTLTCGLDFIFSWWIIIHVHNLHFRLRAYCTLMLWNVVELLLMWWVTCCYFCPGHINVRSLVWGLLGTLIFVQMMSTMWSTSFLHQNAHLMIHRSDLSSFGPLTRIYLWKSILMFLNLQICCVKRSPEIYPSNFLKKHKYISLQQYVITQTTKDHFLP